MKNYPLHLNRTDFMTILSVPQDHCGSHNNFTYFFFWKINFMVFTYFQILRFVSIVLRLATRKHIFIYQKLFKNQILFQNFFKIKNSFWRSKIFIWGLKHLQKRSWKFQRDLTTAWPFVPDLSHRAPGAHVVSGALELILWFTLFKRPFMQEPQIGFTLTVSTVFWKTKREFW